MVERANAIVARELRANPAYELVLLDRLDGGQRDLLGGLASDPDLYGVLRPRGTPALGVKAVDRETALLFLTLQQPGQLPSYVRALHGAGTARLVMQLVADGVLEMADAGGFVSGSAALARLAETESASAGPGPGPDPPGVASGRSPVTAGAGRLAELSHAALRYGEALAVGDPRLLALRLYAFNRRPLTPGWKRRLAPPAGVETVLGIAPGGRERARLESAFVARGGAEGWLAFAARRDAPRPPAGEPTWKLYVSPPPEQVEESFGEILAALAAANAPLFKVGSGPWGLLRPDKIVAYFASFERLAESGAEISRRLGGMPAQGVPFTAELGGGGLLSWGLDPPPQAVGAWSGRESWRLWLAQRLARALLAARAGDDRPARDVPENARPRQGRSEGGPPPGDVRPPALAPWRFALRRLELDGVDTTSWTPRARLFEEA